MTTTHDRPRLTSSQRNKLEARLLRWLDGEPAAALGLPPAPPEAEGQAVRVAEPSPPLRRANP